MFLYKIILFLYYNIYIIKKGDFMEISVQTLYK